MLVLTLVTIIYFLRKQMIYLLFKAFQMKEMQMRKIRIEDMKIVLTGKFATHLLRNVAAKMK